MQYNRFKELWDALVTNRSQSKNSVRTGVKITNGMQTHTSEALIAYGKGDKSIINDAINRLKAAKAAQTPIKA